MVRFGIFSSLLIALLGIFCQGTNVVMIIVDDLGWNDHSIHNRDSDIQTNKLRDIVDNEAILLERFYTNPVCSPTRSSLMTGRYAFNMGMQHTETIMPGSTAHIPMNLDILPKIAKDAGYETYMIGKWHGGYSSWEQTPFFRGFDSFYGYFQGQEGYYDKIVSDVGMGYDFWRNDTVDWSAQGVHSTILYQTEIHRVLERASGPFFLYLALQSLHIPIQPLTNSSLHDQCCQENRWRREYCYLVMEMEHLVYFTIETLKQMKLYNDSLVLFTTDNGGMINFSSEEDGSPIWPSSYGENVPLRGSKATLFEGGVRVTAFITGGVIRDMYRGTTFEGYSHITDFHVLIREMMKSQTDELDGLNVFEPDWFEPSRANFLQVVRYVIPINIIDRGLSYTSVICEGIKMIVGRAEALPGIDGGGPTLGCGKMPFVTLFNLTEDPFEKRQLDCSQTWSLIVKLAEKIAHFVENPFYSEPQNNLLHLRALPKYNNGVWKPFTE